MAINSSGRRENIQVLIVAPAFRPITIARTSLVGLSGTVFSIQTRDSFLSREALHNGVYVYGSPSQDELKAGGNGAIAAWSLGAVSAP